MFPYFFNDFLNFSNIYKYCNIKYIITKILKLIFINFLARWQPFTKIYAKEIPIISYLKKLVCAFSNVILISIT